jgi:hypothetical protein
VQYARGEAVLVPVSVFAMVELVTVNSIPPNGKDWEEYNLARGSQCFLSLDCGLTVAVLVHPSRFSVDVACEHDDPQFGKRSLFRMPSVLASARDT